MRTDSTQALSCLGCAIVWMKAVVKEPEYCAKYYCLTKAVQSPTLHGFRTSYKYGNNIPSACAIVWRKRYIQSSALHSRLYMECPSAHVMEWFPLIPSSLFANVAARLIRDNIQFTMLLYYLFSYWTTGAAPATLDICSEPPYTDMRCSDSNRFSETLCPICCRLTASFPV